MEMQDTVNCEAHLEISGKKMKNVYNVKDQTIISMPRSWALIFFKEIDIQQMCAIL